MKNNLSKKDLELAWKIVNREAGLSSSLNGLDNSYTQMIWKLEGKLKAAAEVKTVSDMSRSITKEAIEKITMRDVEEAKDSVKLAQLRRTGVCTWDFVLSSVDGKSRTIEMAKQRLLQEVK